MKKQTLLFAALAGGLITGISVAANFAGVNYFNLETEGKTENFSNDNGQNNDAKNENIIVFNKMMDVLTHPRCLNCHPSDNVPKQGEDSHPHLFGITRADEGKCGTCHQPSNNELSGVPGVAEWALAPASMAWEGLSRVEIAESMMNRENNGNRSPEDIMHHLTEHHLVLWAWEPGVGVDGNLRETPPVSKEEYIKAVKKWIELGAVIPKSSNK